MEYFRKVTDLETGNVYKISIGEHRTFTETAAHFEVARSSLIKVLLELGVCQKEYDAVIREYRHRLHPDAAKKGLGYRLMGPKGPFDVLSPTAIEWIGEELQDLLKSTSISPETRHALSKLQLFDTQYRERMNLEGRVRWLFYHFPDLNRTEVAKALCVSRTIVQRYIKIQQDQLRRAHQAKAQALS
ncbi:hypothetical protein [Thalassospira xiamenensis]|uniref:Uncharacterized protein n=1 Tax=Thalassospira xiamenensis TaxID=220697 RepID=A0A367XCJ8_9PROT|nr:hypothetical protein [Thalassospira xiamenensis]KZB52425.1 hypothetical protein AUP41_03620 [Thalassospira xiamenensis]RCK51406.1 hypothetical protein TH44_07650 [Thalassospira xiamenensis]